MKMNDHILKLQKLIKNLREMQNKKVLEKDFKEALRLQNMIEGVKFSIKALE